jgi:ADP-heptose:LPS heptosyltransferase
MKRWAAIARFGGIGDNLIAGSPLMALKRMGYMTEMITAEPTHVVYHHNPHIDKLTVKKGGFSATDLFNSRDSEYDIFVHASHSVEGRHALFKAMTSFWWPPEYRRQLCGGSYLETIHDLAGVPYDMGPLFFCSEEEKAHALITKRTIADRFILWVLSGTRVDKVYPYTTAAVPRIIREVGAPVVLMGGPSELEQQMARAVRDEVAIDNGSADGCHIAISKTDGGPKHWPLRSALSFALQADLVVTPDTGTAWAVAMEKMPKIVLISHASVENITKHWVNTTALSADPDRVPCWPCHRLHDTIDTCVPGKQGKPACVSDISVEALVAKVAEKWNEGGNVIHINTQKRYAVAS